LKFAEDFFEDEVREGFYVSGMMKREWAAQIVILEDFDRVCRELGVTWFATYGTLLGAIRHKGFIPWDDDVDIWMKRKDYEKFVRNVSLLPDNYYFLEGRFRQEGKLKYDQPFGRLINAKDFMADADFLERYQGLPYPAGLDIFILDRLAPTKEEEKTRTEIMEFLWYVMHHLDMDPLKLEKDLVNLEKCTGYLIDRNDDLYYQLLLLFEKLCCQFEDAGGAYLASMDDWASIPGRYFPESWFASTVDVPFENTMIHVPVGYDEILTKIWGDYMQPVQAGSSHNYPCYSVSEKSMEAAGDELPYKYYFHPECLEKPEKAERKGLLEQALNKFSDAHREAATLISEQSSGRHDLQKSSVSGKRILEVLGRAQDSVLTFGKLLLSGYPEEQETEELISRYYETLFHISRIMGTDESGTAGDAGTESEQLQRLYERILEETEKRVIIPLEVVFFPFKAGGWKNMEPLYRYFSRRPDVRVYVAPIPYYRRNCWFDFDRRPLYEGGLISEEVPVVSYENMNLAVHTPDFAVTQNPYDEFGIGFTVDPRFFSAELQKYSGKTIYIPWFSTDEIVPDHVAAWQSSSTYIDMPGVIRADYVLLSSENMRRVYINNLTDFAGQDTRKRWERTVRKADCEEDYGTILSDDLSPMEEIKN
jgi:phosphorylcholine metabolism protein LicD